MFQGLTTSPQRGQSPLDLWVRRPSTGASPKAVGTKAGRTPTPDLEPLPQVRPQGVPALRTPPAPTWRPPAIPAPLTLSFALDELQHRDTLCRRPELPMAGRFFFCREVIQADRWVLEIVSHRYSIELLQTPQFHGVRSTRLHQPNQTSCLKK